MSPTLSAELPELWKLLEWRDWELEGGVAEEEGTAEVSSNVIPTKRRIKALRKSQVERE